MFGTAMSLQTQIWILYRTHLQRYAAHIHFSVVRRRDSFERALEPFNLDKQPEEGMHPDSRRSTGCLMEDEIQRHEDISCGMEKAEVDNWVDIDDDPDEDTFEISPYRFYTKVLTQKRILGLAISCVG